MRILGNSKTCPVCRSDIDILSFCTTDDDLANVPLSFKKTAHPDEDRYDIRFSNKIAGTKYEKYLAHVCKICKTLVVTILYKYLIKNLNVSVTMASVLNFLRSCLYDNIWLVDMSNHIVIFVLTI